MMIREFEERTGFFPTATMYKFIEAEYMEFAGDKDAFCAAYKANKDGIAGRIQRKAVAAECKAERQQVADLTRRDIEIDSLKKQIERLKADLDRAEGWTDHEVSQMSQKRFDELKTAGGTQEFTEAEAANFIASEFGFSISKIKVLREIPKYQACEIGSGFKKIRKNGTVDRPPVYNATDWNYIRCVCDRKNLQRRHRGRYRDVLRGNRSRIRGEQPCAAGQGICFRSAVRKRVPCKEENRCRAGSGGRIPRKEAEREVRIHMVVCRCVRSGL